MLIKNQELLETIVYSKTYILGHTVFFNAITGHLIKTIQVVRLFCKVYFFCLFILHYKHLTIRNYQGQDSMPVGILFLSTQLWRKIIGLT